MTFQELVPSFSNELEKISFVLLPKTRAKKFAKTDKKDWKLFEKLIKNKRFQAGILESKLADKKLKSYAKNFGDYAASKKTLAKVPSERISKTYLIKKLPDGRLGCGCKDWQYVRSHQGTDCKHIRSLS